LLEVGLFSNLPTGFRILNYHRNKVKNVRVKRFVAKMRTALSTKHQPTFNDRKAVVERALEKVLT
jgi:hypothetical protein